MALQGTIDTFELTEVVRLLAVGKKTGVLRLEGSRGSGRLWVKKGEVTAIEVDHTLTNGHAEAMFELLRFDDGDFTFASGEQAEPEGDPTDVEAILTDAEAQLAEWREIEKVVPTTRATVALSSELSRADVVLDKTRWRMVAAIGGGITVATLGEALELGELPVSRAVKDLIELGVVDLDATKADEPVVPAAVLVEEPVDEPIALDEPVAVDEVPFDDSPSVFIETEPVLGVPIEEPNSARAQLDEFAAGFGLSDPTPFGAEIVDAPSQDAPTVGHENGFAGFDAEVRGTAFDPPFEEGTTGLDPLSDFSGSNGSEGFGGLKGFAEAEYDDPPSPFLGADNDAAEVARQLSNLSPAAARAVAAAAKATTDEEREAALAVVAQEGDEPIDRELLLRFLASVRA